MNKAYSLWFKIILTITFLQAFSFISAQSPLKESTLNQSKAENSSFDPSGFEFNGSVTAKVLMNGVSAGSEKDTLFAYVGDQLRGLMASYYFSPSGTYLFPIMVFSNKGSDEIIEFRYFNAQSKTLYSCKETINFAKDMIIASAINPFALNVNSIITGDRSITYEGYFKLKLYPNPFKDLLNIQYSVPVLDHISLSVYDFNGKLVRQLIDEPQPQGIYTFQWDASARPRGIYEIRLQSGGTYMIQKVILTK